MSLYATLYRRAVVLDRWANINPQDRVAPWARLEASRLRLWAEVIKAWRLEQITEWTDAQLRKSPRFYAWLSR